MKPPRIILICSVFLTFLSFSQIPQLDVKHYRIEIFVSDETDEIKVDELIEFYHVDKNKPIVLNLASYDRSHKGMQVESLQLNGQKATFNHQNDSIYVTSDGSQPKEQSLKLSYKGIPKDGLIIGKNKYGSRTFLETIGPIAHRIGSPVMTIYQIKRLSNSLFMPPNIMR